MGKSTSGFWLMPRPRKTSPNAGVAEDAEADQRDHQDPGEDVVADRDVGQGHAGGDGPGVLRRLRGASGARSSAAPRRPASASASDGLRPAMPSARRSEPSVTIDLAGREARTGSRPSRRRSAGRARPAARCGRAVLDDVDHEAALAGLDGALRDDDRAPVGLGGQRHLGEEAGLERRRGCPPRPGSRPGGSRGRRRRRRGRPVAVNSASPSEATRKVTVWPVARP